MGWERRSWGICGPPRGMYWGGAWLFCTIVALFTTPIEGRMTPNQGLEQVVEVTYCPGNIAHIKIREYIQQQNSKIQVGQGNIHTYYIQELESKAKQEQEAYEIP